MFIKNGSVDIYYEVIGQGYPLILLHGNGEDHHIFFELAQLLKYKFQLILVDSRHHGKSSVVKSLHYQDMKEDIHVLIQQLDLKKPHILGFSDGAITALMVALDYPHDLGNMILCGMNISPKGMKPSAMKFIKSLKEEAYDDILLKLMLEEPNIKAKELLKIKNKVLLVYGEKDIFYKNHILSIKKHLPSSTLLMIEHHDHGSYIVNTSLLAPIMIDYIKKTLN